MFPNRLLELVQSIHDSRARCCISTTGAGASAISALMSVGGCSRTLLDARVPYANSALSELLDYIPTKAVSPQVAHDLAHSAYRRAERMCDAAPDSTDPSQAPVLFGLGCTAAIASTRQRRGEDLVYVSCRSATEVTSWSLKMTRGLPRHVQEWMVSCVIVSALAEAAGVPTPDLVDLCSSHVSDVLLPDFVVCEEDIPPMGPAACASALLKSGGATTADIAAMAATGVTVSSPNLNGSALSAAAGGAGSTPILKSPIVISVEDAEAMRACLAGGAAMPVAAEATVAGSTSTSPACASGVSGTADARGHHRMASGRLLRQATLRELVTADLTQRLNKSVLPCVANPLQILLERKDVLTRLVVNRNGDVHFDGVRAANDPTQPEPFTDEPCCPAQGHYLLYPGSFAPLHYGHMELARVAALVVRRRARGLADPSAPPKPVFLTFEISSSRVNKRELNEADLRSYINQFTRNGMRVGVSNAMLFIDKARAFPNHAFIVGADTAERVINPTYYAGSYEKMLEALREIEALGCYFVVGGRKIEQTGEWVAPKDIRYPPEMAHLFVPISVTDFRVDVSSTEIRARRGSREGLDLME